MRELLKGIFLVVLLGGDVWGLKLGVLIAVFALILLVPNKVPEDILVSRLHAF